MSADLMESIRRSLVDDVRREMVRFCEQPRTSYEIVDRLLKVFSSTSTNRHYWERRVSDDLNRLEAGKTIVYSDDKWKRTSTVESVLDKFFGGK